MNKIIVSIRKYIYAHTKIRIAEVNLLTLWKKCATGTCRDKCKQQQRSVFHRVHCPSMWWELIAWNIVKSKLYICAGFSDKQVFVYFLDKMINDSVYCLPNRIIHQINKQMLRSLAHNLLHSICNLIWKKRPCVTVHKIKTNHKGSI